MEQAITAVSVLSRSASKWAYGNCFWAAASSRPRAPRPAAPGLLSSLYTTATDALSRQAPSSSRALIAWDSPPRAQASDKSSSGAAGSRQRHTICTLELTRAQREASTSRDKINHRVRLDLFPPLR